MHEIFFIKYRENKKKGVIWLYFLEISLQCMHHKQYPTSYHSMLKNI